MRQIVAIRIASVVGGIGCSREIAFTTGIAPRALGIPMPGLHEELCVLAKSDRTPTRGEHRLQSFGCQVSIDGFHRYAVDSRAESLIGNEAIGFVGGRDVDINGL